jgi:hypothetical protein
MPWDAERRGKPGNEYDAKLIVNAASIICPVCTIEKPILRHVIVGQATQTIEPEGVF